MRLLFSMQDEIDALVANPGDANGGGGSWNVTLADVCLRPLGSACATQSVLQYWGMDREVFEHGEKLASWDRVKGGGNRAEWLLWAASEMLGWPGSEAVA